MTDPELVGARPPAGETVMANETHLRELASRCLWLSHNCYDLAAAAQLRVIATELNAEAVECETRRRMNSD